jgi:nicotinamidase-related amidase
MLPSSVAPARSVSVAILDHFVLTVDAWDNEEFVAAVKKTGRKQIIIAGVLTEVCVAFPTLSAIEAGYEVFVITDCSGTFDEVTRQSSWSRMEAAGAQLLNWVAAASEMHVDWRNDVEGFGKIWHDFVPEYKLLIKSYEGSIAASKAKK